MRLTFADVDQGTDGILAAPIGVTAASRIRHPTRRSGLFPAGGHGTPAKPIQAIGGMIMARQVDVHALKRKLAGTGPDASVNCAVVSDGYRAYLKIDRIRPSRKLRDELVSELESDGLNSVYKYFGTAYADAFPGILLLTLNKPASGGLARLLTIAVRGSGYRKVRIAGTAESEEA